MLLVTDKKVRQLPLFETVQLSLKASGIEAFIFDDVQIEPTDESLKRGIELVQLFNQVF